MVVRMLSLRNCRRILGSSAEGLSDRRVRMIRKRLYSLAEIVVESYREAQGEQVRKGPRPEGGSHATR